MTSGLGAWSAVARGPPGLGPAVARGRLGACPSLHGLRGLYGLWRGPLWRAASGLGEACCGLCYLSGVWRNPLRHAASGLGTGPAVARGLRPQRVARSGARLLVSAGELRPRHFDIAPVWPLLQH